VRRVPVKQGHVRPAANVPAVQQKGDVLRQEGLDLAADAESRYRTYVLAAHIFPLVQEAAACPPHLGQPRAM